jgi:hypothetical protein
MTNPAGIIEEIGEPGLPGIPGVGALTSTSVITFSSNPIANPFVASVATRVRVDGRAGVVAVAFPEVAQDQILAVVDLFGVFYKNKPQLIPQSEEFIYDNASGDLLSPAYIVGEPGQLATYYFIGDTTLNAWIPA